MKRSEMTQISTRNKGALHGHNLENILERHYGRSAYVVGLGTDLPEIVVNGFFDDRILSMENLRRREDYGV